MSWPWSTPKAKAHFLWICANCEAEEIVRATVEIDKNGDIALPTMAVWHRCEDGVFGLYNLISIQKVEEDE